MSSKVVLAVLIAFFPVVLGTVLGLRSVSSDQRALVRTMGASWWNVLLKVRAPAALPFIMSGMKLAAIYCVSGAIIGEFVGSDHGIGWTVLQASAGYNVQTVFAATGYVVLLGLATYLLLSLVETAVVRGRRGAIR
jgi:ABC-type nitrate/sulfonate/bicarbonate transport system permease component